MRCGLLYLGVAYISESQYLDTVPSTIGIYISRQSTYDVKVDTFRYRKNNKTQSLFFVLKNNNRTPLLHSSSPFNVMLASNWIVSNC